MRLDRLRLTAPILALAVLIPGAVHAAPAGSADRPVWARHGARLSTAYERMLRDELAAGRVLPADLVARHQLDVPDEIERTAVAPADALRRPAGEGTQAIGMAPDHQANDRSGDASCAGCAGRPLSQSETTIAAIGDALLAGWNDSKGFCSTTIPVQGWGLSTDGGVTWTDLGEPPAPAAGYRFRGDPVHAANPTTGKFYVLGLLENPANGALSGLVLLDGHVNGAAFVVDGNRQISVGGANFIDKPWLAVDPASGTIVVTYSNFVGGSTSQIELIRSTDGGTTWSAPLLMHDASQNNDVQGSRPVFGPGGELYVYWYRYGYPLSEQHVRRSNDAGVSFGPDVVAATFYENGTTGGAGYRRGFAPTFASIAVDRSNGPHRGRVHLAWDEAVNFYDAPAPTLGNRSEVESNAPFANATSFSVGQVLRGTLNATGADTLDLWTFNGTQGQTLFFACDSATSTATAFQMRIQCDAETTTFQNFRFLAFSQANFPWLAYTLPHTGRYYLRMFRSAGAAASYRLATSWDTPSSGERSRDMRDQFAAWSDDGVTWSTPVRINGGPAWADGLFPEVTVDGLGRVHAYWHDWRDDVTCGSNSLEYLVSSGDGGVTWGADRALSDASSFWSINACGSANQGDYQGITSAGSRVFPCWADARLGDADVFAEADDLRLAAVCPSSPQPVVGGGTPSVSFSLTNPGNVATTIGWRVQDSAGWLVSAVPSIVGQAAVGAGASAGVTATFAPPANCPVPRDTVRFVIEDQLVPGYRDTCQVVLQCGVLDAPGGARVLSLAAPRPNPGRGLVTLEYSLPRETPLRLAVYGAGGRQVRTLATGLGAAGTHVVVWDGRDDAGHRVAPGVYWAQLTAGERRLQRMLTMVR